MRWALGLSYQGSGFSGWQVQPPPARTVQVCVEQALEKFQGLSHSVPTICAGRTDTGVHALDQVVHFTAHVERDDSSWVRGLNALLPSDITVNWAKNVSDEFDARLSATSRRYHYVLLNSPNRPAIWAHHAGWVWRPLNALLIERALPKLLGTHDFSSFRSSQCQAATPIRTMLAASCQSWAQGLVLSFEANAFLHHMIRNIVGCIVDIGIGRKSVDWMDEILAAKDRRLASPTFAPQGLYFAQANYPERFALHDISRANRPALPFLSS